MNQENRTYHSVTTLPKFDEVEWLRVKASHDEAQALYNAERKGRAEGIAEREKERVLVIAKRLLGFGDPIDKIVTVTGLTREEVEKLCNVD